MLKEIGPLLAFDDEAFADPPEVGTVVWEGAGVGEGVGVGEGEGEGDGDGAGVAAGAGLWAVWPDTLSLRVTVRYFPSLEGEIV